jgi:hypothetical protein
VVDDADDAEKVVERRWLGSLVAAAAVAVSWTAKAAAAAVFFFGLCQGLEALSTTTDFFFGDATLAARSETMAEEEEKAGGEEGEDDEEEGGEDEEEEEPPPSSPPSLSPVVVRSSSASLKPRCHCLTRSAFHRISGVVSRTSTMVLEAPTLVQRTISVSVPRMAHTISRVRRVCSTLV